MTNNQELWGCAHNEERSPFSTRKQTCSGELRYLTKDLDGIKVSFYICTKHLSEEAS